MWIIILGSHGVVIAVNPSSRHALWTPSWEPEGGRKGEREGGREGEKVEGWLN